MAITLPPLPRPWRASPTLVDFGADLTPPLGGPIQRVTRLGSRFKLTLDPADYGLITKTYASNLLAALLKARATGQTVILPFPQMGASRANDVAPANALTPLVDGAGQSGTVLNVRGLAVGAQLLAGQFGSVTVSGRSYLYVLTDSVTANALGKAALNIAPMLRASPADGAAMSFASPQIEGWLSGMEQSWSVERLMLGLQVPISIMEAD